MDGLQDITHHNKTRWSANIKRRIVEYYVSRNAQFIQTLRAEKQETAIADKPRDAFVE